jgi:hypothetical protein
MLRAAYRFFWRNASTKWGAKPVFAAKVQVLLDVLGLAK